MPTLCGDLAGAADADGMAPFWNPLSRKVPDMAKAKAPGPQLTTTEQHTLDRLEALVEAGVAASSAVLEAGRALAEIRRSQLYRTSGDSWEAYVRDRFGISRRRADQMAAFAGVADTLEESGTGVPASLTEGAARPLVGLAAEEVAEVVAEAAAEPGGISPASIRKAAGKRKKKASKAASAWKPRRWKVAGWIVTATPNRKASAPPLEALRQAAAQEEAAGDQAAREAA